MQCPYSQPVQHECPYLQPVQYECPYLQPVQHECPSTTRENETLYSIYDPTLFIEASIVVNGSLSLLISQFVQVNISACASINRNK